MILFSGGHFICVDVIYGLPFPSLVQVLISCHEIDFLEPPKNYNNCVFEQFRLESEIVFNKLE